MKINEIEKTNSNVVILFVLFIAISLILLSIK